MVAVKFQNFGGMIPAVDDRLLPDSSAAYSRNAWLYAGTLRGIATPAALYQTVHADTRRVFRLPKDFYDKKHLADSYWMEFADIDTDVVHAPIINDTFNRYYWASPSDFPRYDTYAHITAAPGYQGTSGYLLGIPAPASAPTCGTAGGISAINEVRAYLFTYVSAYGEEGPPSPPVVHTGKVDDVWTITYPAVPAGDLTGRNITKKRLYRTITSSAGVATYFMVNEDDIAAGSFADSQSDIIVSGNNELESQQWSAPPSDIKGFHILPNGLIAGWREDEIWFCEPYRPHAWPGGYTVSVENPIIGFGAIGQSLIVLTTGAPYALVGTVPGNMSLTKIAAIEPCFSRGSIVSAPEGVYFASPNGLMLASQGTILNVTRNNFTKDRWLDLFDVTKLRATRVGTSYYAFGNIYEKAGGVWSANAFSPTAFEVDDYTSSRDGMIIDTVSDRVSVTVLYSQDPTYNIMTDVWSGEPFILRGGVVYWLDVSETAPRETFLWRSKVFQPSLRKNFEAMRVWFDIPSTITFVPSGPIRTDFELDADEYAVVRIYADGQRVMSRECRTSGELIRLPSGFKATFWQIEVEGRVTIYNIEMATSAKELMVV